jgi:hypothetical protein
MRDVQRRYAECAQVANEFKQPLRFGRRKRAGRLVEDQDARPGADRAGDLHELHLRRCQAAHRLRHVELHSDPGQKLRGPRPRGPATEE